MTFYKYHGLGNDYLVYDPNRNKKNPKPANIENRDCPQYFNPTSPQAKELIQRICNRNFGLGADGILIGPLPHNHLFSVRIFNPDGSEAEKSGNGVRIFAKYLKDAGYITENNAVLHTIGGTVRAKYNNENGTNITVSMGTLDFSAKAVGAIHTPDEMVNIPLYFNGTCYPCTCVSIGNPHCVIPMEEISKAKVCEIGKYSETADYFPDRINTQIVKLLDSHTIQIEIYERGAGYTLASGSSSCAAAGAMQRLNLVESPVNVHMPGGVLRIELDELYHVWMTGDVEYIGSMNIFEEFRRNI